MPVIRMHGDHDLPFLAASSPIQVCLQSAEQMSRLLQAVAAAKPVAGESNPAAGDLYTMTGSLGESAVSGVWMELTGMNATHGWQSDIQRAVWLFFACNFDGTGDEREGCGISVGVPKDGQDRVPGIWSACGGKIFNPALDRLACGF